jgi:PAS domain S-box-containing protein
MTQPSPDIQADRNVPGRAGRDLLVVAGLTLATFLVSSLFQVREWLTEATRPLERWQLDELPLTFAMLALSLAWFSLRRWREAARQLRLREQADAQLAEREQRFRTLFMEDLAGNALASEAGEIRLCNPAMARVLGFAQPELATGHDIAQFYGDRAQWAQHRAALQRGEKVEAADLEIVSRDGTVAHAIARMWPWYSPGRGREVHISLADVSEVRLMQSELADALAGHRRLAQQYMLVQEEERRSLARELHDEMGQCLNAIKLDAVSIRSMAQGRDREIEERATAIVELSGHVYDVVRGIMQRLRPAALDALGLRDALAGLVAQWSRRNAGVQTRLDASGALEGLGEAVNITAYRLVQECLTNVVKHAGATHVTVAVERTPEGLRLSVSDDGRGMDLQAKRSGLGLLGLRERVEALSGRLELQSAPGRGVVVHAHIPVAAPFPVQGEGLELKE